MRETFHLACTIFLRLLGLCWLAVFVSLVAQVNGLLGSHGILPVSISLERFAGSGGWAPAWLVHPSIFWINSSDAWLNAVAVLGIVLSGLMLFGIFTGPALLLAWVIYGSIVNVGGDFFAFQWDYLILETSLLAAFLVPWQVNKSAAVNYNIVVLWLLRWLLFRVHFCSGAVKLLSGCAIWRDLTALNYYYQAQLLPNYLAWYAHRLPAWVHFGSAMTGMLVELLFPFCMFAPRKIRLAGALSMAGLQLLMAITGNHGFINYLTMALCILLLDDEFLRAVLPGAVASRFTPAADSETITASPPLGPRRVAGSIAAYSLLAMSTVQFAQTLGASTILPKPILQAMAAIRRYHVVGWYGLYPVVYTERTEIVVEGSDDLKTWQPYEFKYKVGDLHRAPPFLVGWQPRLDWRMRFAALENPKQSAWFNRFIEGLLSGSPAVLSLMGSNPFPDHPPKYIRADLYRYEFTDFDEQKATGNWWKRADRQTYWEPERLYRQL